MQWGRSRRGRSGGDGVGGGYNGTCRGEGVGRVEAEGVESEEEGCGRGAFSTFHLSLWL